MKVVNRAQKLTLLQSLLNGTATATQINTLQQIHEPIHVTFILDDDRQDTSEDLLENGQTVTVDSRDEDEEAILEDYNEPTYHIECYTDGTTRKYYRYPDGRIEAA